MKLRKLGNNQTEIQTEKYDILVSYETAVACYDKISDVYYITDKFHSKTTSKHISSWLPIDEDDAAVCGQRWFDALLDTDGRGEQ